MISDKGCVPHDLIPKNSLLNSLYKSIEFKKFLTKILEVKQIYPYKDKLSSINYNYYEKTQQLGWHFDNASFAITLMIQSAESGGDFEYVSKGRDFKIFQLPFKINSLILHLYWHENKDLDPANIWMRNLIFSTYGKIEGKR